MKSNKRKNHNKILKSEENSIALKNKTNNIFRNTLLEHFPSSQIEL